MEVVLWLMLSFNIDTKVVTVVHTYRNSVTCEKSKQDISDAASNSVKDAPILMCVESKVYIPPQPVKV